LLSTNATNAKRDMIHLRTVQFGFFRWYCE